MREDRCDRCGHLLGEGVWIAYRRGRDGASFNRHLCGGCAEQWDAMTGSFFVHAQAKEGEGDA